jgi:hypothetical protein
MLCFEEFQLKFQRLSLLEGFHSVFENGQVNNFPQKNPHAALPKEIL